MSQQQQQPEQQEIKEIKEEIQETKPEQPEENKEIKKEEEKQENPEQKETKEEQKPEEESKEKNQEENIEIKKEEEKQENKEEKEEEYPIKLEESNITINKNEKILGEYKYCRFCGGEPYETNVSYLPITNGRVGNFPIVLNLEKKNESNYICLHHWRENRKEYLEHYVQNEKTVIDEASVLLYASMLDKKMNFNSIPNVNSIPEDTKNLFRQYLGLTRKELQMAMGSVPAGLSVTSDLLCNACGAPTQQMFDLSLFPQSFVQFLAWQRLMQIYSKLDATNIELLNALKKEGMKEAEHTINEATKFAMENPSDARKRLQPEFVPENKMPASKRQMKQENVQQMQQTLPSIESNTKVQNPYSLPPMTAKPEKTKNYPYFKNFADNQTMIKLTKPKITIGRNGRENNVDLDLSKYMDAKSISHLHAFVEFDFDTRKWSCTLKGRNGLKIDNVFRNKDSVVPLQNGSVIETNNFRFSFVCPDDFDGTF